MAPVLPATDWITTSVELEISALVVVMSMPSSSVTSSSSTKAPRVPEPSSREITVMGPDAVVPSASAQEEELSSEAELWEVLLSEVLLSEVEPSLVEEVPLLQQPASMEAHRVSAKIAERTFFIVMTFLLVFLGSMSFSLPTAT